MFSYMRRHMPMMQILIVGILPRGAWSLPNPYAWPNRLTEGIALVNNASQVFIHPLHISNLKIRCVAADVLWQLSIQPSITGIACRRP